MGFHNIFDNDKNIQLNNCENFYVRMFSKSGERRFVAVSKLPHANHRVYISTKNQEFSLYDSKGREKCVIFFPKGRYLSNNSFAERNTENFFGIEWQGDFDCTVTYLKKSYKNWIFAGIVIFLILLLFV